MRSLELSLEDTALPDLTNYHWDEYFLRDMAERFCLMFVHELINKYGANLLVKAKFVERWLAKQRWGDSPDTRRRNFRAYMDLKGNRIVDIVERIKHSKRGLRALERSGLIDRDSPRRKIRDLPHIIMPIEEEIVDESTSNNNNNNNNGNNYNPGRQARRSLREHSAEEQRLRRQHREAMVLNDGTRPFGQEDIIERDQESPM